MRYVHRVKKAPNLPPLGGLDHAIYLAAVLLTGGCGAAMFAVYFGKWKAVSLAAAPEAICVSQGWLPLVGAFLMFGLCGCAVDLWCWKYPIFGARGCTYGGVWDPIFPAMMRDENAPPEVKKAVSGFRGKMMLWGLGCAVAMLMMVFGIFGGIRLYADGTMETRVGFGEVTASYGQEDIDRVFVSVEYSTGSRRYGTPRDPWIEIKVRTTDNKIIRFDLSNFRTGEGENEIDALRAFLASWPEEKVRFENGEYLYLFRQEGTFDAQEMAYLEGLFGVE